MKRINQKILLSVATILFLLQLAPSIFSDVNADNARITYQLMNQQRNPVIFVHGCPPAPPICVPTTGDLCTNEQETHLWSQMIDYFKKNGYPESRLRTFLASGPTCDSIITQSKELSQFVNKVRVETGATKVDLIGHSMGALTIRLYLLQENCSVDHFVSIAGSNHGSATAKAGVDWQEKFGAPSFEGAKQMFPPYACKDETLQAADIQFRINGCLITTGRTVQKDETPGSVHYLSIRNSKDEIVIPRESACLNQNFQNDCSDEGVNVQVKVLPGPGPCGPKGCPGHVAMLWNPGVMKMTLDFVTNSKEDE